MSGQARQVCNVVDRLGGLLEHGRAALVFSKRDFPKINGIRVSGGYQYMGIVAIGFHATFLHGDGIQRRILALVPLAIPQNLGRFDSHGPQILSALVRQMVGDFQSNVAGKPSLTAQS